MSFQEDIITESRHLNLVFLTYTLLYVKIHLIKAGSIGEFFRGLSASLRRKPQEL